ncbi:putative transposase [Bradyrhizobium elkanii]
MKRARFTEEQIIAVLQEHETGRRRPICRSGPEARISEATFYNWKAKYGGMDVSEARRLRALRTPN